MAVYGLKLKKSLSGVNQSAMEHFIVKANTTITKGDLVQLDAGYLDIGAASEKAIGVANETVVQGASATKTCAVIIDPLAVYEIVSDATVAQTTVGTYCDITGATGAMLLDGSEPTTTGQLLILETDGATTNSTVQVMIAETQLHLN